LLVHNPAFEVFLMKHITASLLTAALMLASSVAIAQPGPMAGHCGAGAAASGPAANCPPRSGMGPGARSGANDTPGWSMMSRAERDEHRNKLRSFKSYDECKAYVDKHHELMVARAKEKGGMAPAQPRRDACAGLKAAPK
jgi:hypothetical protein